MKSIPVFQICKSRSSFQTYKINNINKHNIVLTCFLHCCQQGESVQVRNALGKLGKVRLKSQLSSRGMWASAVQTRCVESNDADKEEMKNRSKRF